MDKPTIFNKKDPHIKLLRDNDANAIRETRQTLHDLEQEDECPYGIKAAVVWGGMLAISLLLWALLIIAFAPKAHADTIKTASWYGVTGDGCDPWKHTTTANGDHFDENALTAASWKYALGSCVKVTNLHNGKSVIVRINDRGPGKRLYLKGRVIDLSRGAFARVADLRDGVIPVSIALVK